MKNFSVPENVMNAMAAFLQKQEPVTLWNALQTQSKEIKEPKPESEQEKKSE